MWSSLNNLKINDIVDTVSNLKNEIENKMDSAMLEHKIPNQSSPLIAPNIQAEEKNSERDEFSASNNKNLSENEPKFAESVEEIEESRETLLERLKTTKQALIERERQLESLVMMKGQNLTEESAHSELIRLREELKDERDRNRANARTIKNFENVKVDLAEKERIISAYEEEGKALAQSQSDMERTLRRVRTEHKVILEEKERAKAEIEALNEKLAKAHLLVEEVGKEKKAATAQISVMQGSLQNIVNKQIPLENELKALGEANSKLSALCKESSSKIEVLEQSLKEANEREATLKEEALNAGNKGEKVSQLEIQVKELQETMRKCNRDFGQREDLLRVELETTRKKLDRSIIKLESYQRNDNSESSKLLGHISSLEEQIREECKSRRISEDDFRKKIFSAEKSLSEKKTLIEKLKSEIERSELKLRQSKEMNASYENALKERERKLKELSERIEWGDSELAKERRAKEDFEGKYKASADANKNLNVEMENKFNEQLKSYRNLIEALKSEIEILKGKSLVENDAESDSAVESSKRSSEDAVKEVVHTTQADALRLALEDRRRYSKLPEMLGFHDCGGETKIQHALDSYAKEVESFKRKLCKAEAERDALASEVNELSKRSEIMSKTVLKARELKRKNEILLELLGEMEEKVEILTQDLDDAKIAYKEQILQLTNANKASA
mmetsp:Transcript_2651/g.3956  ORF Transcript_2651/g.3956 Transcript_2651/m.3956 type:complete len:681 (+) Transcript_2651:94-2136(+)